MSSTYERTHAHTSSRTLSNKYRPEIDGLRAFAVVAVIINHFNKDLLPSGYLGVDIFFVISGYVITSSLAERESKNFLDFLTGFYERRIKRLVPALVVFVLITSVLICLFNPIPGPALGLGWRSLFGISNINLYRTSSDYFAQSTELNPFTHTWSLGVEEQFYLLFPFLIWFSGFGQQKAKGARNLFIWVGALTIASLIGFIYLYQINQPAAYFLMPPRFWEMAAGCLLFIGFQKRARIEQALEQIPPLLVVAAMVGVMFLPVAAAVPATIGIVVLSAVLIACLKQGTTAYKFFTLEKVVYIGLISYSLYLWHWTVLSISRWTIGIHWWLVPIQIGLMLMMAIGSYKWIETPLRQLRCSRGSFLTITQGIAINFGAVAFVFSLSKPLAGPIRKIQASINPPRFSITEIVQQEIYCHLPKYSLDPINDCLKKTADSHLKTIFIIGDSHASNHFPSLKGVAKGFGFNTRVLIDWGFINSLSGSEGCQGYDPCIENSWEKHLNFFKSNLNTGDIILFSWFREHIIEDGSTDLPRRVDVNKVSVLEAKLVQLSELAKEKKANLLLVDDIPLVCPPGINYHYTINHKGKVNECTIRKEISKKDRIGLTHLFQKLSSKFSNVLYADFHDALCTDNQCNVLSQDGNKLLYGDGSGHFTSEYPDPLVTEWKKYLSDINQKLN